MKLRTAVWLFGCLVLALGGAADPLVPVAPDVDDPSGPYAVISERNMFHLNPVPPEAGPEPPKVELPVVKFFGFFRVGRVTKALFCSLPKDKKEEPTYYNLSEGEKSGFLEVVQIHFEKGEVEVVNSGVTMTLTLKMTAWSESRSHPRTKKTPMEYMGYCTKPVRRPRVLVDSPKAAPRCLPSPDVSAVLQCLHKAGQK
jgi:hypothetical protein